MKLTLTPLTNINRAVIVLSMLNVVFADYASDIGNDNKENAHYSRQWAVYIEGGKEVADKIASKHDFINLGNVSKLLQF